MHEALKEWVRLVLRLPAGSPHLPTADGVDLRVLTPAPNYLRYALLWYWIGLFFTAPVLLFGEIATVVGAAAGAGRGAAGSGWLPAVALVLGTLVVLGTLFSFWLRYFTTALEVDMLRYTFSDRAMRLRRGVMHLEEVTISYANVQNIRFLQGPVQRAFGLADLVVDTAGGGGRLPQQGQEMEGLGGHRGLIKGVADPEALRDWILERMRHCRGAGLGDATEAAHDAGARSHTTAATTHAVGSVDLTLAATERLLLIRDELRAARAALTQRAD